MREATYQGKLIKKIKEMLPGCVVLKNDPAYLQGVPDLLVMYGERWGALEVKTSETAHRQPNQDYYVEKMNNMSYASFIYPENERQVLDELQRALHRGARVSVAVDS